jgi:CheY-like chemotaxis protein
MEVLHAENGREGIKLLNEATDVDLVLLDIMMPELDGYETMKAIREIEGFGTLPIIALTAKAMKADRDKCIEAGASDYISKPLDIDQLMSLLRVCKSPQEARAQPSYGLEDLELIASGRSLSLLRLRLSELRPSGREASRTGCALGRFIHIALPGPSSPR